MKPPFKFELVVTLAGRQRGMMFPTEHHGVAVEGCHFRIADADDHALCFCHTRENAQRIVDALNMVNRELP